MKSPGPVKSACLRPGRDCNWGPRPPRFTSRCAPFVQDVVIAGHDRDYVAVLIFPNIEACRAECKDLDERAPAAGVLQSERVRSLFRNFLAGFAKESTGSSNRIVSAI